jgi:hypothetical protein
VLSALIDEGILSIIGALEAYELITHPSDAVEMQEGVFQVSDGAYKQPGDGSDEELKGLVDSVTSSEEEAVGSIVDIVPFAEVDLSIPSFGKAADKIDENDAFLRGLIGKSGFDYDRFIGRFRSGTLGIVKSLMRISHSCSSMFAAVIQSVEAELKVTYSIGLSDESVDLLEFSEGDECRALIMDGKYYALVKDMNAPLCGFENRLSEGDKRYVASVAYVPTVFQSASAYLVLGFRTAELEIRDIVQNLNNAE